MLKDIVELLIGSTLGFLVFAFIHGCDEKDDDREGREDAGNKDYD